MKVLKVTNTRGDINYFPANNHNIEFHETWKRNLSSHKRDLYKIEHEELTDEEAAELGFAEAIVKLNPPIRRKQQSVDMIQLLTEQNQLLMRMLEEKNTASEKPKKEKANG